MRSFQEDHELQQIQHKGASAAAAVNPNKGADGRPRSASPAAEKSATKTATEARISPIRQAAQLRPTSSRPSSPAAAADPVPASAGAEAKPDEVTTFRTNITIGVMIMCVVLLGMVAVNSGTNSSLTFPRAVVFFIDGASAGDVERAVALSRAPFLGMLADAGTSTIPLGAGTCVHGSAADGSSDSASLVVEMLTGSAVTGASSSIVKRAKAAGIEVALLGGWPMVNEPAGHGCWALSSECEESCLGHGESAAAQCNFDTAEVVERPVDFINATRKAINEGSHLVVARVPSTPVDPTSLESRDEALYTADAAIGRAAMAAFERTVETNENILIVTVAASAQDRATHISVTAFQAAEKRTVAAFERFRSPPRLGDVAAIVAAWLNLDVTAEPLADAAKNSVICGTGAAPTDCVDTR